MLSFFEQDELMANRMFRLMGSIVIGILEQAKVRMGDLTGISAFFCKPII